VECIVDAHDRPVADQEAATQFFATATGNLHRAEEWLGSAPR
jgi:hypothetical protein